MNKTVKGLLWAGAGVAALAAVNSAIFSRAKAQGNPLGGEGRFWPGPYGDLFYTRQGRGLPVILVHGIYEGASGYEWRKNYDMLSEHFNVYALDWLGFGLSDKPRIKYSAEIYIEQLKQFITEVVGEPCAIVASSLGAAYAVQTAYDLPDSVKGLILVCPTGFDKLSKKPSLPKDIMFQAVNAPLVGTTLHNAITSTASLRYYLMNETYFDPSYVDDALVEHYFTTAHQYGSQNAPPAFISGQLNFSVAAAFPQLKQKPLRIVWGREAQMTPLSDAEAFLAANSHAELTVFDKSGLLPHDEQAQGFNRLVVEQLTDEHPKPTRSRAKKQGDS
jgi:pimeloyl-ACP methyl ester carboxylesterase